MRPRRLGDIIFRAGTLGLALSVLAITGTVAAVLLLQSRLAREAFGWSFLWTSTWDPVALRFGALPFIYGTLMTTFLALALAVPVGLGGKGNEGVAGLVKQTPNAIGYVELIYALQNKLPYGDVRNRAGQFVLASLESVTAAAAAVTEGREAFTYLPAAFFTEPYAMLFWVA